MASSRGSPIRLSSDGGMSQMDLVLAPPEAFSSQLVLICSSGLKALDLNPTSYQLIDSSSNIAPLMQIFSSQSGDMPLPSTDLPSTDKDPSNVMHQVKLAGQGHTEGEYRCAVYLVIRYVLSSCARHRRAISSTSLLVAFSYSSRSRV